MSLLSLRTPPDDGGRGLPPWSGVVIVVALVAALGVAVGGWLLVAPGSKPPRPRSSSGAGSGRKAGATATPSPSLSQSPTASLGSDEENGNGANSATSTVVAGAPGTYGPTAAWVVAENAKPGTPSWALSNRARQHQIEGYADRVSIDVSGNYAYVNATDVGPSGPPAKRSSSVVRGLLRDNSRESYP